MTVSNRISEHETTKTKRGKTKPTNGEAVIERERFVESEQVTITPPNMKTIEVEIEGDAPYVQCKMAAKAVNQIREKQLLGDVAGSRRKRAPRDYDADYIGAQHRTADGTLGIPATAFKKGMVDACRVAGMVMTMAKRCIFVEADGYDAEDGTPLVFFTRGEPRKHEMAVRLPNGNGTDIRVRPWWNAGWRVKVRIRFDADRLTAQDVVNLMNRLGTQEGIGEGRAGAPKGVGMGWGSFRILPPSEA